MKELFKFFIPAIVLFASCSKESVKNELQKPAGCDSVTTFVYSYLYDVKPVVAAHCSGETCHSSGTGNYDFTKYENIADNIRQGSFEYRLLLPVDDPQHMPQYAPPSYRGYELAPCDLYKIRMWIKQGYRDN